MLSLKERAKKDRNAQKPCDATNGSGEPRQMNQSPARLCERRRIGGRSRAKTMKQITKRENSLEPQENADRIDDAIINHDRLEETLLQRRRREQRINDRRVVPNIERAPENLRNHRRERGEQECVTFARRSHFLGSVHGRK